MEPSKKTGTLTCRGVDRAGARDRMLIRITDSALARCGGEARPLERLRWLVQAVLERLGDAELIVGTRIFHFDSYNTTTAFEAAVETARRNGKCADGFPEIVWRVDTV